MSTSEDRRTAGETATLTVEDLGLRPFTTSALGPEQAERLAATLDAPAVPGEGAPLPLLWHWAYFTPSTPTAGLGPDGHPRLPAGAPTARFPRRMWAGGRVSSLAPLVLGRPAERHSTVLRTKETSGKSGDLLVVTLEHRYRQGGADAVVEEQDLVYRAAGAPVPLPEGDGAIPAPAGGWSLRRVVEPPMLFRFSALTFNSHRIHYDAPYATEVEGYPGLVVHGPLTAVLLAESARVGTGREVASFDFRATAPLFAGLGFDLVGDLDESSGTVDARAVRNDGQTAMAATIRLLG
ncbi:MAG: acyl-CoA dehydrogenase [Acidimicrobiia bacterium]|nr:acyl-CoA dehydrogenase [Acidimicrobiia bacterium]